VWDRSTDTCVVESRVPDDELVLALRLEVRTGVAEAEWLDDRSTDVVPVGRPGGRLDDESEESEPQVGVVEGRPDRDLGTAVDHELDQLVRVGERPVEDPVVSVRTVTDHAGAHLQQLPHGGGRDRGPALDERRYEGPDRVVESQESTVGELEQRGRRERLRLGGDPEQVLTGQAPPGLHVRVTPRSGEQFVAVVPDRDLHRGQPELPDLVVHPLTDVRQS
jgi:hypothetical protein